MEYGLEFVKKRHKKYLERIIILLIYGKLYIKLSTTLILNISYLYL